MIQIEITNKCNFKCYFCGARNIKHPTTINTDKFKELIDDCEAMNIKLIYLTPSDGDIFMDPDIMNKLSYIASKNIKIEFFTNFTAINKKQMQELKELKELNNIIIRVSDYGDQDRELFKFMTRTSDKMFDKYQSNLKFANSIGLILYLSSRNTSYDFSFDNTKDLTIEEKYRNVKSRTIKKEGVCSMLYSPRIMSNGDFVQCRCSGETIDLTDDLILGNVYNTPLKELYFHYSRYSIFKEHQQNIYNGYCLNCDSFETNDSPNINILKTYLKIKKQHDQNNK